MKEGNAWVIFALLALIIVSLACDNSSGSTQEAQLLRTAWISGYEDCPSHSEYGQLAVEAANLYRTADMPLPPVAKIPHSAKVDVLEECAAGMCRVRFGGQEGYVQEVLLVDYDPSFGVRPNPDNCL